MANKSAVVVALLLCVAGIIEVQARTELIGSDSIESDGLWGKKGDYKYHVPLGAVAVTFKKPTNRRNTLVFKINIGSGSGEASLSWSKGSRTAKVHAWVNGKFCVSFWSTCRPNRVSWKVFAHFN